LFRPAKKDDDDGNDTPIDSEKTDDKNTDEKPKNQGSLLIGATCAPAWIAYPTDINLLNEAREKL